MEVKKSLYIPNVSIGNKTLLLLLFFFSFSSIAFSQTPKTGRMYFLMQQDSLYQLLSQKRMDLGTTNLDSAELRYLNQHEVEMEAYFKDLTDKEQSNYFRYQEAWKKDFQTLSPNENTAPKKDKPFMEGDYNANRIRYMFYALQGGLIYGITSVEILEGSIPDAKVLTAFPIVTSVGSFLVPAIWTQRYGNMSYSAFRLGSHGINMGPIYGFALSNLILGTRIEHKVLDQNGVHVGGTILGPYIGMAIMSGTAAVAAIKSYNIGKNRNWHDSRALTMRTYARIGCLAGLILPSQEVFRVRTQDGLIRAQSFQFLAGATAGYGLAHIMDRGSKVIRSRGEAIVAESFTFQGIAPGFLFAFALDGRQRSSFLLVPASMAAFGIFSQWATRGTNLTPQQGREVAIASWAANASINLITIIALNDANPISLIPASMGSFIAAYWLSRRFKKLNTTKLPTSKKIFSGYKKQVLFTVMPAIRNTTAFHPQNPLKANAIRPEASLSIRF